MRKPRIVQFRVEDVLYSVMKKIAEEDASSITDLIYKSLLTVVRKKLDAKAFDKLIKELEQASLLNKKPGRKPRRS